MYRKYQNLECARKLYVTTCVAYCLCKIQWRKATFHLHCFRKEGKHGSKTLQG